MGFLYAGTIELFTRGSEGAAGKGSSGGGGAPGMTGGGVIPVNAIGSTAATSGVADALKRIKGK